VRPEKLCQGSVRLWEHIQSYNCYTQKYCCHLALKNLCLSKSLLCKHTSPHVSTLLAHLGDITLFRPRSLHSSHFPLYCLYHPHLRLQVTRVNKGKTTRIEISRPLELQEFEAPRIYRQSAHEGDEVVSPTHQLPLPHRRHP